MPATTGWWSRRSNQAGQVLKSPLVLPRHARTRAAAQAQFPKFMYNSLVLWIVPFCKTCNFDANWVKYTGQYSVFESTPFKKKKKYEYIRTLFLKAPKMFNAEKRCKYLEDIKDLATDAAALLWE
jgi:hypothetical protein